MLKLAAKVFIIVLGVVVMFDGLLPSRKDSVMVDRHTTRTDKNSFNTSDKTVSYKLHFTGGSISSCSVGKSTYSELSDGDALEVISSRIFKSCIKISKNEQIIKKEGNHKLFMLIGGLIIIATAFGATSITFRL